MGAGEHRLLQAEPYVFSRALEADGVVDRVVVALDQPIGEKTVPVSDVFPEGAELIDAYSGTPAEVRDGGASLATDYAIVLLAEAR